MIDWVEFLRTSVNPYYVFPGFSALVVFWVQWRERTNKKLPLLLFQIGEIFSVALSIQYITIFLILGWSLPAPLNIYDKVIVGAALIFVFLIVFYHTTRGTKFGTQISNILDKYFSWSDAIPVPVSLLDEQLGKLRKARDAIIAGDKSQLEWARQEFLEHSASALEVLRKFTPTNEDVERVQTLINSCEERFLSLSNASQPDEEGVRRTVDSLTILIGTLGGIIKSLRL